jgi:aspartokinase
MNSHLQVMKFGGTSLGNAECIRRAAGIVARAAGDGSVVAVVSAMGGVTDCLMEAAQASAVGDLGAAGNLAETLRRQSAVSAQRE